MQDYIKCKRHVNKISEENLSFLKAVAAIFGTLKSRLSIQFQKGQLLKCIQLQMKVI